MKWKWNKQMNYTMQNNTDMIIIVRKWYLLHVFVKHTNDKTTD